MKIVLVILISIIPLVACNTSYPLRDINNRDISAYVSTDVKLEQVERAILAAGKNLGWRMRLIEPGLIEGTLNLRAHKAVVRIPFDTKSYSVKYVSSRNLDYDGSTIHRSYPRWINNLTSKIDQYVVGL